MTPPAGNLTGSLTGAAPTLTYTAPTNQGNDFFVYEVSDGSLTAQGTITIHVPRANVDPVADDDTATTTQETPVLIDVLANDTDADGDDADDRAANTNGTHGTVTCTLRCAPTRRTPGTSAPTPSPTRSTDGFGGADDGHRVGHHRPVADRRQPAHRRLRRPGPGATSIQLADIPYERMRELDVDVSNSPFVKRAPFVQARAIRPSAHHSPSGPRSPTSRRSPSDHRSCRHAAVRDPGRLPRWLAGVAGRAPRSPASRRRASPSTQFLALYDPPGPPTQALRDLTLEDIVVLRRHAAGRRQPGRVPDRRDSARAAALRHRDVVRPRARRHRTATSLRLARRRSRRRR